MMQTSLAHGAFEQMTFSFPQSASEIQFAGGGTGPPHACSPCNRHCTQSVSALPGHVRSAEHSPAKVEPELPALAPEWPPLSPLAPETPAPPPPAPEPPLLSPLLAPEPPVPPTLALAAAAPFPMFPPLAV